MFVGSSPVRVEKQGRFKLPQPFVKAWEAQEDQRELHITTLLSDQRILIYSRSSFHRLQSDLYQRAQRSREWIEIADVLNANGGATELGRDNRIAIPARVRNLVRDHMGIELPREALLVGNFDHLELRFDTGPLELSADATAQLYSLRIPVSTSPPPTGDSAPEEV